jgi:hypothetical protein
MPALHIYRNPESIALAAYDGEKLRDRPYAVKSLDPAVEDFRRPLPGSCLRRSVNGIDRYQDITVLPRYKFRGIAANGPEKNSRHTQENEQSCPYYSVSSTNL